MHDEELLWITKLDEFKITLNLKYEALIVNLNVDFDAQIKVYIEMKERELEAEITLILEHWTLTLQQQTMVIIKSLEAEMYVTIENKKKELAVFL